MSGTELVFELFSECRTGEGDPNSKLCILDVGNSEQVWSVVQAIIIAMFVKAILTIVTFGIKLPAGIFIPTLGVGACAGRLLGVWVKWLHWKNPGHGVFDVCGGDMDCVIPGLYAMVGAAAALSGVTVCNIMHLLYLLLMESSVPPYHWLSSCSSLQIPSLTRFPLCYQSSLPKPSLMLWSPKAYMISSLSKFRITYFGRLLMQTLQAATYALPQYEGRISLG